MKRLLLIVAIIGLAVSCIAQPSSPKVWRKFNAGYGPRTAAVAASSTIKDSLKVYYAFSDSLDGHTGTYNLTSFNMGLKYRDTVGVIGNAFRVNNDSVFYLQVSNAALGLMGQSFTVQFWARANRSMIGGVAVMGSTFGVSSWAVYDVSNEFRAYIDGGMAVNALTPPTSNYTLYTITYNAVDDSVRFYEDGVKVGAYYDASISNAYSSLTFGAWSNGSTPFYGAIDEFYYWRGVAVSDTFITWYFNNRAGQTYSAVIAYPGT